MIYILKLLYIGPYDLFYSSINQCIIGEILILKFIPNFNLNLESYVSIKTYNKFLNTSKKSVCLIKANGKAGTGFLIKLSISSKEKPLYGLITNNHVLDSKFIKYNKSFNIYFNQYPDDPDSVDSDPYVIPLNENYFIFTSELIDITFIQLPDGYSKNSDFIFLDSCYDDYNKKEEIHIFQYPETILSFATGNIKSSSGFNYFHDASTNSGSSGAPLINKNLKVIGVHKIGVISEKINVATNINIVKYAISTLFNKDHIYDITKARESPRKLSEDEKEELKKHGLKEITRLSNMYICPYSSSPLVMLFSRTNHGWYFTLKKRSEIKYSIDKIKLYDWTLINLYKKVEDIISEFGKELEHQHELIISWLKISELMYM